MNETMCVCVEAIDVVTDSNGGNGPAGIVIIPITTP